MEFSTHYNNPLPTDLQGAVVPFNDGLKTIVSSKGPQQHSEETEDELEEPHDGFQLRDRTCRLWVRSYILYDFDAPKASGLPNGLIALHCAIISSAVLLAHQFTVHTVGALHVGTTPDNLQVVGYDRQGCLRGSVDKHRSERRKVSVISCDGWLAFNSSAFGTTFTMTFTNIVVMRKLVYGDDQYLPEKHRAKFPVSVS